MINEALSGSYSEDSLTPLPQSSGRLIEEPRGSGVLGKSDPKALRRCSVDSHGLSNDSGSLKVPGSSSSSCNTGCLAGFDDVNSVKSNASFANQAPSSSSTTPTIALAPTSARSVTIEHLELEPSMAARRRSNTTFDSPVRTTNHLTKRRLNSDTKVINDYLVYTNQVLGIGSYSKVKLCRHQRTETWHAMKIMDKSRLRRLGIGSNSGWKKAQREIAVLKQLRHENVIALLEVIDDPEANKLYLVLELAGYGSLMHMLNDGTVQPDSEGNNKLPEAEARRILRCVVSALKYVHASGIAHRDLKPENLVLTDDFEVKLSDFGVSAVLDGSPLVACHEREGSVAFLSPEVLRVDGSDVDLFKVDVWALGVTAFVLLHGRLPWIARSGSAAEQLLLIESATPLPFCCNGAQISDEAISFIQECLHYNPEHRLSAADLANHPWLADQAHTTPYVRPSHDVSADDLETAITTGCLRELSTAERSTVPAVPEFIIVRYQPKYGAQHFAMSPQFLQQSFDDSCLALLHMQRSGIDPSQHGSQSRSSPVLSCPSPYGRARSRGMEGSPAGQGAKRSISMPPLETAPGASPLGIGGAARQLSATLSPQSMHDASVR